VGDGTTEAALDSETQTGKPVGATDGHAVKSAQAIKNINENITEIDATRKVVSDPQTVADMDAATTRGKGRIGKMRPALDRWNSRVSSNPTVWNPDGTSKVTPGFPENPGPL
jgi:hypothetical protein